MLNCCAPAGIADASHRVKEWKWPSGSDILLTLSHAPKYVHYFSGNNCKSSEIDPKFLSQLRIFLPVRQIEVAWHSRA